MTFSPLSYSTADTQPTVRGVIVHNAKYESLCDRAEEGK